MKLAILGPLNRGYEEVRLIEEAQKIFDTVSYFPIPQITIQINNDEIGLVYKNRDILDYDAFLPRIPRSYKNFGYALLSLLSDAGKNIPIKPESVIISHNKFLTLVALQERNIPVPRTILTLKREIVENLLDEMKYPVVLKLLYGSRGVGVMFADSKQSAISFIDALERFNEPIFVEDYIENPGEDIRAYVVGGKVIASMKRVAKEGERRANIGIGGKGEPYELSPEEKRLAERAAKAIGMKICGIDIINGPEGPMIIETNVNAQFHGLEDSTGRNVAGEIVRYIEEIS